MNAMMSLCSIMPCTTRILAHAHCIHTHAHTHTHTHTHTHAHTQQSAVRCCGPKLRCTAYLFRLQALNKAHPLHLEPMRTCGCSKLTRQLQNESHRFVSFISPSIKLTIRENDVFAKTTGSFNRLCLPSSHHPKQQSEACPRMWRWIR